ncbi:MAG: outer membrane beta-barrel protein [Bacteroidaceae bacterium]|nr:outer membrane beta-barrel protein [Bacteroidaceae bacterium]
MSNANGLSVINTLNPSARIKLSFRKNRWSISMQAKYDNNNVTYKQASQYNQHGHIYEVRLDPQVDFPFGMRINSSLIYYGRRGYADDLLNHDQWLVNATVSQSFLKNKALTLQFEVVDLLRQRTAEESRFSVESRSFSRTETFLSYMMLHAIYKFTL